MLCTDGPAAISERMRGGSTRWAFGYARSGSSGWRATDGLLEPHRVRSRASRVARRALFFSTGQRQASDLAARLGCRFTQEGAVATGKCEATNVPGLYVCGDASKEAQFVVVAAAEGTEAAMAINQALLEEDARPL